MSSDTKLSPIPSFAAPPPVPSAALSAPATRVNAASFTESLLTKVGKLLGGAIDDAINLEVQTYTSSGTDSTAAQLDHMNKNMRLRALTKIKIDGDTVVCVPLSESGQPDETLWRMHNEIVQQARADRKETLEMVVQMLQKLVPGGK